MQSKFLGINGADNFAYPITLNDNQFYISVKFNQVNTNNYGGILSKHKFVNNIRPYNFIIQAPDNLFSGHLSFTTGELFNPIGVAGCYNGVKSNTPFWQYIFPEKITENNNNYYVMTANIFNYITCLTYVNQSLGNSTNSIYHLNQTGYNYQTYYGSIASQDYAKDIFTIGQSYNIEQALEIENSTNVMIFGGTTLSGIQRCYTYPISSIDDPFDMGNFYYFYTRPTRTKNIIGKVVAAKTWSPPRYTDDAIITAAYLNNNYPPEIELNLSGHIENLYRSDYNNQGQNFRQEYTLSSFAYYNNYYLNGLVLNSTEAASSYIIGSDVYILSGTGYYNPLMYYVELKDKNNYPYFKSFMANENDIYLFDGGGSAYSLRRMGNMNISNVSGHYFLELPDSIFSKKLGVVSGDLNDSKIIFNYAQAYDSDPLTLRYPLSLVKLKYNNKQVRINNYDIYGEYNIGLQYPGTYFNSSQNTGIKSYLDSNLIKYDDIECIPSTYICIDPQSYSIVF